MKMIRMAIRHGLLLKKMTMSLKLQKHGDNFVETRVNFVNCSIDASVSTITRSPMAERFVAT